MSRPVFPVVFLSFDEPNAKENLSRLRLFAPEAQHVQGVKGILRAHQVAASHITGAHFFVVDGDAFILDGFRFDGLNFVVNEDAVYVWRSRNAVNGLEYGYGGVKLLPRNLVLEQESFAVDLATSIAAEYVPVPCLASQTRFNSSPYHAWRGAFRECVKLSRPRPLHNEETERRNRLAIWTNEVNDCRYGDWCLKGANDGVRYYHQNVNSHAKLQLINDFLWLEQLFMYRYGPLMEGAPGIPTESFATRSDNPMKSSWSWRK